MENNSRSFHAVIEDLNRIYRSDRHYDEPRHRLTEKDVGQWIALTGLTRDVLCDRIGIHLASAFHRGEVTFEFCDEIVNDIFGLVTGWDTRWPELFFKVYLAFDEGEYYHDGNTAEDPVEVYTKPQIAQIVRDYQP